MYHLARLHVIHVLTRQWDAETALAPVTSIAISIEALSRLAPSSQSTRSLRQQVGSTGQNTSYPVRACIVADIYRTKLPSHHLQICSGIDRASHTALQNLDIASDLDCLQWPTIQYYRSGISAARWSRLLRRGCCSLSNRNNEASEHRP